MDGLFDLVDADRTRMVKVADSVVAHVKDVICVEVGFRDLGNQQDRHAGLGQSMEDGENARASASSSDGAV